MNKFKVNEIFYSIQAEGRNAGRPAVFVRFAGCNLRCPFCDTDHEPYREMTAQEIEDEVKSLHEGAKCLPIIVFTGGEPTLQLNEENELLKGYYRAMETNGIIRAPSWIDWVTISPKTKLSATELCNADELKFLYGWFDDQYLEEVERTVRGSNIRLYIQPTADKDMHFDATSAINFAKAHTAWTLSLQFHKLLDIR